MDSKGTSVSEGHPDKRVEIERQLVPFIVYGFQVCYLIVGVDLRNPEHSKNGKVILKQDYSAKQFIYYLPED